MSQNEQHASKISFRLVSNQQFNQPSSLAPSRPAMDPSDLGGLINSPQVNLYKTSYYIKGGTVPKTIRKNHVF